MAKSFPIYFSVYCFLFAVRREQFCSPPVQGIGWVWCFQALDNLVSWCVSTEDSSHNQQLAPLCREAVGMRWGCLCLCFFGPWVHPGAVCDKMLRYHESKARMIKAVSDEKLHASIHKKIEPPWLLVFSHFKVWPVYLSRWHNLRQTLELCIKQAHF